MPRQTFFANELSVAEREGRLRSRVARWGRWGLILGMACGAGSATADTVWLTQEDGRAGTAVRGEIVDYSGATVRLRRDNGREENLPSSQVHHVDYEISEVQQRGDAAFAKRDWETALAAYREAGRRESRLWVRRLLLLQSIRAAMQLQQHETAARMFAALGQSDPLPVHWDVIPLAWRAPLASAEMQEAARGWLQDPSPAVQLLAASWLLTSDHQAAAQTVLAHLQQHEDPAVAGLAAAQLWRLELATSTTQQANAWHQRLDRLPRDFRGGPTYLVALAYARHEQPVLSALLAMRVVIDYPHDRSLAADALLLAGRQLEAAGNSREALQCYEEILTDYADTPALQTARSRHEALTPAKPQT